VEEQRPTQERVRAAHREARRWLGEGAPFDEVVLALMGQGWPPQTAARIASDAAEREREDRRAAGREPRQATVFVLALMPAALLPALLLMEQAHAEIRQRDAAAGRAAELAGLAVIVPPMLLIFWNLLCTVIVVVVGWVNRRVLSPGWLGGAVLAAVALNVAVPALFFLLCHLIWR